MKQHFFRQVKYVFQVFSNNASPKIVCKENSAAYTYISLQKLGAIWHSLWKSVTQSDNDKPCHMLKLEKEFPSTQQRAVNCYLSLHICCNKDPTYY